MEEREIGSSGIRASVVGLGCNNFGVLRDADEAAACVRKALDEGITLFDMASEHGDGREEEVVGAALGARRGEVVIATKVGEPALLGFTPDGIPRRSDDARRSGLSRRWIRTSAEESLRRLKTDYIDLYQLHTVDPGTPVQETLTALDDLVRQGKVRAAGVATRFVSAADLGSYQDLAAANGLTQFASMQAQYSLLVRDLEKDAIPELQKRGMSLLPFSPLANGLLTGKYRRDAAYPAGSRLDILPVYGKMLPPGEWDKVERLRAFAAEREMTMVEVAVAWLLSEPAVAGVIAGATSPGQVTENAQAAGRKLSGADRAELDRITL